VTVNGLKNLDTVIISVDVTNTRSRTGAEVTQIYVSRRGPRQSSDPFKEVTRFKDVQLTPRVTHTGPRDIETKYTYSFWNDVAESWVRGKVTCDCAGGYQSARLKSWKGGF